MTRLPPGKTRLDLVREAARQASVASPLSVKQGRMVVSIDRLAEDPRNERKTFRNMEGLIASIGAVGIVEPITVSAEADGTLRIVTGHRRYRAAKAAGLTRVEVIVREPDDERTRRLKSIVSNAQREDVGVVEMAEALQSLLDDKHFRTQRELSRAIGKPESWVSEVLSVLSIPAELLERVRTSDRPIPYDAMTKAARLADRSRQRELIEGVLSGATVRDVRERITGRASPSDRASGESTPKPKRVFHTPHGASVIVQAEAERLAPEQVAAALRHALDQAIRNAA